VTEDRVRKLLRETAVPDEVGAERRGWAVVRPAYDSAGASPARRWPTRPLLVLAAALAVAAAAASPPGQAVGGWVREAIGLEKVEGRKHARPALTSLPARGRVLVVSRRGTWIVRADGSKRRLGAYADASWSPQGLFVVATRGRQVVALTPTGQVRWTVSRPQPVSSPRWSPSGFRIAYGTADSLRIVHGDGEPDRLLARSVAPQAWAWRPGEDHVLAYADRHGRLHVVNADTRHELWRAAAGRGVREIVWSADGERVLVLTQNAHRVYTRDGRLVRSIERGSNRVALAAAFAPKGHMFAFTEFALRTGKGSVVLVNPDRGARGRIVFRGSLRLLDVEWSPDGRWLLVAWPAADQWLFLRGGALRKIVAVSNIARQFDPGGRGRASFPRLAGWCCP
jgi:Tol biopolymer transport system component